MSQEYSLFKKQRNIRSWRGAYNFEKSREFELAEKWFEERRQVSQEYKPTISSQKSEELISNKFKVPPGLSKSESQIRFCKKCAKVVSSQVSLNCCKVPFCLECSTFYIDLFNRCVGCKTIIDKNIYDQYDGLDLKIPSYENFNYIDHIETSIL